MNIHKNARLTPHGRGRLVRMVLGGQTPQTAARSCCVFARLKTLWPHTIYVTLDLPKSVSRVTSQ